MDQEPVFQKQNDVYYKDIALIRLYDQDNKM
jgi:hypothetical protein